MNEYLSSPLSFDRFASNDSASNDSPLDEWGQAADDGAVRKYTAQREGFVAKAHSGDDKRHGWFGELKFFAGT